MNDVLPELRKGALAAQNPRGYESIEEFDEDDRNALRIEATSRWKQTRTLYLTIILNSIAAAIQGWDQTGTLALRFVSALSSAPVIHTKQSNRQVRMEQISLSRPSSVSQTRARNARAQELLPATKILGLSD